MSIKQTKTILLMRHGKSSWLHPSLSDFDRSLDPEGIENTVKMARFLRELNKIPNHIISSPAVRAKQTTETLIEEIDFSPNHVSWNKELYYSGAGSYADAIRNSNDSCNIVMTVGHNPMTEDILDLLANNTIVESIGTATIACLETDSQSWDDIDFGHCEVKWIVSPDSIDKICSPSSKLFQ